MDFSGVLIVLLFHVRSTDAVVKLLQADSLVDAQHRCVRRVLQLMDTTHQGTRFAATLSAVTYSVCSSCGH